MTDQEYEKKYGSKTVKQLCNQWRRDWIKVFKKWEDEETIKAIKKITDEDIIKYGISELLEKIKEESK